MGATISQLNDTMKRIEALLDSDNKRSISISTRRTTQLATDLSQVESTLSSILSVLQTIDSDTGNLTAISSNTSTSASNSTLIAADADDIRLNTKRDMVVFTLLFTGTTVTQQTLALDPDLDYELSAIHMTTDNPNAVVVTFTLLVGSDSVELFDHSIAANTTQSWGDGAVWPLSAERETLWHIFQDDGAELRLKPDSLDAGKILRVKFFLRAKGSN